MATKATESVRVDKSLYHRMQAWQKKVKANTGREPTFTGIFEAMETLVEEDELLALLIKNWRDPNLDDLQRTKALIRKNKPATRTTKS